MVNETAISILRSRKIKVTPQRIAVLDAILKTNNHPHTEHILRALKENHPHIASGTVYKILDLFVEESIIKRVKTDGGNFRYDHVTKAHHHLYCADSDRIEDYYDEKLNNILNEYFAEKSIPDFKIDDIRLQLVGRFTGRT